MYVCLVLEHLNICRGCIGAPGVVMMHRTAHCVWWIGVWVEYVLHGVCVACWCPSHCGGLPWPLRGQAVVVLAVVVVARATDGDVGMQKGRLWHAEEIMACS